MGGERKLSKRIKSAVLCSLTGSLIAVACSDPKESEEYRVLSDSLSAVLEERDSLSEIVRLAEETPQYFLTRARAAEANKERNQAIAFAEELMTRFPDSREAAAARDLKRGIRNLIADSLREEASSYMEAGNYAGARTVAHRIQRDYDDTPSVQGLNTFLSQVDRQEAAEKQEREERQRREREERERSVDARKWTYRATTDEMTGRSSRTARIRSENTVNFDSPYDGSQRATLTLRNHPSYGRDVIFRIEKGQLLCNSYDRCRVRVRFDDGQPQTWKGNPPSDHSTTVLFFQGYSRFIQRLRQSNIVRIQPEVFQEGNVIFEFRVGGYDHSRYTGG